MHIEKVVPDTSIIIEGLMSRELEKNTFTTQEILIHEAVLSELEHHANQNKATGHIGIDELTKLQDVAGRKGITVRYAGRRPTPLEIKHATWGEIDSLIRDLAFDEDATLMTADKIQAKVAKAKGIHIWFLEIETVIKTLKLEKFFDDTTMSVHLRENVLPFAKKGFPGNWTFTVVGTKQLTREMLQEISREIIEEAKVRKDCFIEIERPGSTIIQLQNYRIVITKPPFSDGWEITAVRPVKKMQLDEYAVSEKLMRRISEQAEGILVAGSPGAGKSTFASALAEFYAAQNKIVKTVETPRDLVLPDTITQYSLSHGDAQEIHDILLLSRPDYALFDEMRNTEDFKLFADLRLAGIGFMGVIHATKPIDAIQRFVGRIELGVIPQVIDTVIYIKDGFINKVLGLHMVVKVPSGMTEADLARPVVVVNDFETKRAEFELYSYGEETVVIPVSGESKSSPVKELAKKQIEKEMRRYCDTCNVEMTSENKCIVYVPERDIARIIGKEGKTITAIEKELGISIDIESLAGRKNAEEKEHGQPLTFQVMIGKNSIIFQLDQQYANHDINLHLGGSYFLTAKVSKKGILKLKRDNKLGKILTDSINAGEKIEIISGREP